MNRTRIVIFAAAAAAAMVLGGVLTATALAKAPLSTVYAAASPSPAFRSNEDPTHEKNESAAQEAAENNGTFHPGAGGPGHGPSNETPSHEATESPSREASEQT